jgi:hypothetical protein
MNNAIVTEGLTPQPQAFLNGEVHDWYRTVWGYSDHLVASLLKEFATPQTRVLDPFCGSGTTLVECMKHGVDSAGIDANPVSYLAAKVKTNWRLNPDRLGTLLEELEVFYDRSLSGRAHLKDPTYLYLEQTGMLDRGWISSGPLKKAIALKHAIRDTRTTSVYREALTLALLNTLLRTAANVKFGPELYCGKQKKDADVFGDFAKRIGSMAGDLQLAKLLVPGAAVVVEGDSRYCGSLREQLGKRKFSLVICSPPYPAEHDYTRNSRLELAFLEKVSDRETLREIKRKMVRSHTKGIYIGDKDADLVAKNAILTKLAARIDVRAADKSHGFARLYSKVTTEYFGGMKRHMKSLLPLLKKDAIVAYVVGDQSSYLQVPVKTAKILASLAKESGYDTVEIRHWRNRVSRSSEKIIVENILILRKTS